MPVGEIDIYTEIIALFIFFMKCSIINTLM